MTKINSLGNISSLMQTKSENDVNLLKTGKKISDDGSEEAASGFEALLLHNMLKEMWKTSDTGDGLLGENSHETQLFRDMLNQAIADEVSKGEGIGIKQFLKKELSKTDSPASNKSKV